MARRVFFSFHFQADAWRASQVRNYAITKRGLETIHPIDHADWEKIQRKGDANVKRWIDDQIKGSSVTVVLVGAQTHKRPYVHYEIKKSIESGKGLLVIHIDKLKNQKKLTSSRGGNPLDAHDIVIIESWLFGLMNERVKKKASDVYNAYCWVDDNGPENFHKWVEAAAIIANR